MTWWPSNNPSRHKTLPARIILTPTILQTKSQVLRPALFISSSTEKRNQSKNNGSGGKVGDGHGMAIAAANNPLSASHGSNTRRWRNRRRGCAGAGRGLHRRAAEPCGVPELRAGREHGGDAGRVVLLGAQGRGEEGGGLPLPGLPGQPGLRRHAQHDQGPAAARRLQGQDASLQQVPPFRSGCDWWVSSSCSIVRGSDLRGIAVVVHTFCRITSWNRRRRHRSSSVPIVFRSSHFPVFSRGLPSRSNCCCDSAHAVTRKMDAPSPFLARLRMH